MHRKESSEEQEEGFSDEGVSDDEKQTADGLEFGAPEILSRRGHAVRHNLPSFRLLKSNVPIHLSQMAVEQQQSKQQPLFAFTPARSPQNVVSALTTSGLVSESPGAESSFKGSTTFESPQLDVPSQSPAEKLEAVKQYLRDRSDQPLHHVEYVGLVSLLKDSVQGPALCYSLQSRSVWLTVFCR